MQLASISRRVRPAHRRRRPGALANKPERSQPRGRTPAAMAHSYSARLLFKSRHTHMITKHTSLKTFSQLASLLLIFHDVFYGCHCLVDDLSVREEAWCVLLSQQYFFSKFYQFLRSFSFSFHGIQLLGQSLLAMSANLRRAKFVGRIT